jgi:FKBP-type peptidyl-prolyl cis-trans isomerase
LISLEAMPCCETGERPKKGKGREMKTTATIGRPITLAVAMWAAAAWLAAQPVTTSPKTMTSPAATQTSVALESGVLFQDIVVGTGPEPRADQRVGFHYVGKVVETGKVIDDSRSKIVPNPLRIKLSDGKIIKGLADGLVGMRVGGRRLVEIPPELGYGDQGVPPEIPPKAHLLFDVELVEVQDVPTTATASAGPEQS